MAGVSRPGAARRWLVLAAWVCGVVVAPRDARAGEASTRVLVAVDGARTAAVDARIRSAVERAGYPAVDLVDAQAATVGVALRPVVSREADGDCGARVETAAWKGRLGVAEASMLRLALPDALSALTRAELEVPCLTTPLAAPDLLRAELDLATVHQLLARSSGGDAQKRAFHQGERDAALARAAAVGLSPPADLSAEVRAAFTSVRSTLASAPPASVFWASTPGVVPRWNGRVEGGAAFVQTAGPLLVQAVGPSGRVEAAARWSVAEGERWVVWVAPDGRSWTREGLLGRAAEAGGLDADALALLGALGRASDPDATVVWAVGSRRSPTLYRADPSGMVLLSGGGGPAGEGGAGAAERVSTERAPVAEDPVPRTPAAKAPVERAAPGEHPREATGPARSGASPVHAVGLGPVVGAASDRGEALAGLAGAQLGGAVWVRWPLGGAWAVAGRVAMAGTPSRLAPVDGGGLLFRGSVPLEVGARWSPGGEGGGLRAEVGADVGADLLGSYDGRFYAAPLLLGAAGIAGDVDGVGWRVGLVGGGGLVPGGGDVPAHAYGIVTVEGGLEWRW